MWFFLFVSSLFLLKMATFDLTKFIDQPSVEGLGACRKNDLFLIAQHYEISVSKTQRKAEIKACIMSALVNKGVFSSMGAVSVEAVGPATIAAGSPSRVPVGDQSTPVTTSAEVGAPFSCLNSNRFLFLPKDRLNFVRICN